MPEEKPTEDRVVTIKGTQKPPIGEPYYGNGGKPLANGLKVVYIRQKYNLEGGKEKYTDLLKWYEKVYMDDGVGTPLVYLCKEVTRVEPDCLYPVVVWNITPDRLDEQDNIPCWKMMPVLGEDGRQIFGADGRGIVAFHWVVVNDRYEPNVDAMGRSDDGNMQPGDPIIGADIIAKIEAEASLGGNPLQYRRRRVTG